MLMFTRDADGGPLRKVSGGLKVPMKPTRTFAGRRDCARAAVQGAMVAGGF
jgi:hypothetical protein